MNYCQEDLSCSMYFIELLVKYFQKDKVENLIDRFENEKSINPLNETFEDNSDESEFCEHIFMPIDSTGETFACSRCGLVINKSEYEKRNFFNDKNI